MKETWLKRTAWILALTSLVVLVVSILQLTLSPAFSFIRKPELLSGAIVACGAPLLGLVILNYQLYNRIGWLWLGYALAVALYSFSNSTFLRIYPFSGTPSGPLVVLVILAEMANVIRYISIMLVMLLFPDGNLVSRRWRFMTWWTAVAFGMLNLNLFVERIHWTRTDGVTIGPGNVLNPIGFLPESLLPLLMTITEVGFFSLLAITLLAAASIVIRYRSSGQVVRTQILWLATGSVIYAVVFIGSIFFVFQQEYLGAIIDNLAILPFYLAIGIAILRYRLWDIDVIIRRTLQYSLLTGLLALVYFGSVLLGQRLTGALIGDPDSPLVLVVSTLLVAALFNPVRHRVQDFIDRRFYRRKYDAEKALARFAAAVRDELDMELLCAALIGVAKETMQPEQVNLWLKSAAGKYNGHP